MLLIRLVVFTLLAPGFVAVVVPLWLRREKTLAWNEPVSWAGWPVLAAGVLLYLWSALEFYRRGRGTPAIFFTRHLRFLIGEEPARPVSDGLYRVSRNPMYIGMVLTVAGQGFLWKSRSVLMYSVLLWVVFHFVVVWLEEPHLRTKGGAAYEAYCRSVPRWLGWPHTSGRRTASPDDRS